GADQGFRLTSALLAGESVGDVREFEGWGGIGSSEPPGNGRSDGSKTEDADAAARRPTFARTIAGCLERIQPHSTPGDYSRGRKCQARTFIDVSTLLDTKT